MRRIGRPVARPARGRAARGRTALVALLFGSLAGSGIAGAAPSAAERLQQVSLTLTPASSARTIGEEHRVTATLTESTRGLPNRTITFAVAAGPHAGLRGSGQTGEDGTVAFAYTGTAAGTDTIEAVYVDPQTGAQHRAEAQVTWSPPQPPPAPRADLGVSLTPAAPSATVGRPIALTAAVVNRGPDAATGVRVVGSVSELLSLASVSASQGTCSSTAGAFTCLLGTLGSGASASVTISGTATAAGELRASVEASADQVDPNGADNAASATVPAVPAPLPPPRLGRAVNVVPVRGTVLVNGRRLREGEQIPVGAVVDTRRGMVSLRSSNGTARFRDGLFRIVEPRVRGGFTELRLLGGNFLGGCGHPVRRLGAAGRAETHRKKVVRRLWGNGTGRFRTTGRFSAATVRGTIWQTADRCDGTLTTVRRGRVVVLDRVLRKRVVVRAGRSYLARPRGSSR